MTLIVAMVGTDGIVAAADRKHLAVSEHSTSSSEGTKGFVGKSGRVLSLAAEQDIALAVAREIAKQLDGAVLTQDERVAALDRIGNEKAKLFEGEAIHGYFHGTALTIFADDTKQIYRTQIRRDGAITMPYNGKQVAGSTANPALFFMEKLYSQRPVKDLTLLAAHTVLTAHQFDERSIEGLDLWLCRESGIEQVATESLVARSEQINGAISALVFES